MQPLLILSTLVALFVTNGSAARPAIDPAQDPAPQVSGRFEWIGPKLYKAGTVVQGQLVTHTMRFMNGGEDDLTIARIRPTCKCMSVAAVHDRGMLGQVMFQPDHVLPPGEVMELGLTIDTTGKHGDLHSRLEITHSGAEEPEFARVVMDVIEPFVFTPETFSVGTLRPDGQSSGSLELTSPLGQPFVPEVVGNRYQEHIDVTLHPIEPNESGSALRWRLDIAVRGGLPFRKNSTYPIQLTARVPNSSEFAQSETDGSKTFSFRALVRAQVVDWITYEPRSLNFGRLWAGRDYQKSFAIYCHDDDFALALTAEDVTIEGPYGDKFPWHDNVELTLTATPEDNSVHVKMRAHGFPKVMKERFEGSIVVATGHPEIGTFRVPFSGQIR